MYVFKRFVCLFTAGIFLASLTGCGGGVRDKDTLEMWLVGSEAQAQAITRLAKDFTEETGIKVRCQAISWGDAHSRYLTSIAGGVAPDIGTMGLTWGMEFGELGALVDLNERFPEDTEELEGQIFPSILEATQVGESVYGLPFDITQMVLYYRTDIISEPPRDWDELIATLQELQESDRGMVLNWGSLEWIGYSPFLWQAGGDFYNEDKTRATLDSTEAARALEFMAELYRTGVPRTQVPLVQGMRTGDYPMAISGNWQIISLELGAPEIAGKWAIAPLPKGPTGARTAFIGGRILSILSDSPMQEEAWDFIKFLFSRDIQLELYEDSLRTEDAYLPPNIEAWDELPMREDFKEVLLEQAKDAKGPPAVLSWDASTRHVNYAIQRVVLQNADAAAELRRANQELQLELEQRH